MKQVEVQIMGQGYLLGCPDGGESRLLEAVERVDNAMCRIRDAGKIKARDRIAVLAALNLAFELADRSTADLQTPPPAPVPQAQDSASPADENALLASLLVRLDRSLGDDGQLL